MSLRTAVPHDPTVNAVPTRPPLQVRPDVPGTADLTALRRRFAPIFERIAAGAADRDVQRTLPYEEIRELNAAGFATLRVPRSHGGPEVSVRTLAALLVDLAAADSNVAHQYRSHYGFLESLRHKAAPQQDRWYRLVLEGATVGNASTETSGNALGTLNTTLERLPDGDAVLTGCKGYATASLFSTHTRVSAAVTDDDGRPTSGRCFAVVPVDHEGVELYDDWDGFGQRLTATGTAVFTRVPVDRADVFERQTGTAEAVIEAAYFQLFLLAVLAGIATGARDTAAELVRRRTRTFNTGSGALFRDDPLIQEAVGRIASTAFAVTATVLHAADALDTAIEAADRVRAERGRVNRGADDDVTEQDLALEIYAAELAVEQAQVTVPEAAIRAASELFHAGGASNTRAGKALDRFWRNAQTVATHNPIPFRARSVGDWFVNGTLPEGLNAIGDAPQAPGTTQDGAGGGAGADGTGDSADADDRIDADGDAR